jgi:hypothetical protein
VPTTVTAFLLGLAIATLLVTLAATPMLGGPYGTLRRTLMPFLWIGSREWQSSFAEFSHRITFTRQDWVVAWGFIFMLAFLILVLTLPHLRANQ